MHVSRLPLPGGGLFLYGINMPDAIGYIFLFEIIKQGNKIFLKDLIRVVFLFFVIKVYDLKHLLNL